MSDAVRRQALARFAGRTVLLVGGGPSLTPEDLIRWRGQTERIAVVNDAVYLAPDADLLWFSDAAWADQHWAAVAGFGGVRATLENDHLHAQLPGLLSLRNRGATGFSEEPDGVAHGSNGGYACMHLLLHARPRRIVLLGFDCKAARTGATHWFGDHTAPLHNPSRERMRIWAERFGALAEAAAARGVTVLNASPDSAIRCFEPAPCARSA